MIRRALALSAALVALSAAPALGQDYAPGSDSSGDPFFPQAGNGGYDAVHYDLKLEYVAETKRFDGRAVVSARATQNLSRFNLDLRDWMVVKSVHVNGRPATFEHSGQELVVTPARGIPAGTAFDVRVTYGGTQQSVIDPDESEEGWIPTDDGAFVVNEPQGSPGWYPVNDSPKDKATYTFRVTVPAGRTVMANGELVSRETENGETTWHWRERDPMAPYLATATNGVFQTSFYTLTSGLEMYDAVDPNTRASGQPAPDPVLAWSRLAPQGEIIGFFSNLYGDYPYTSGGGIIDWAPTVGYALESQTRANYHRTPGASTVVHEIAHQWFGNAVTLEVWPDIWLNEGFARWSEWIYTEKHGGATAQSRFDTLYARQPSHPFWSIAPGDVKTPENLFAGQVYDRGAMTLQALRQKIGSDATFFEILQTWYAENRNGNVSTADFVEVSERVSGLELSDFFEVWLYQEGKPTSW